MRYRLVLPAVLVLSLGGVAAAQTIAPTQGNNGSPTSTGLGSTTSNNAVSTSSANNPGAPVPGANSFTESEARTHIQGGGYSQVTELKLDNQGIWRGRATKNGQSVSVALDYQGNVSPK